MEVGKLMPEETSLFIREYTKQKDWTEISVKNNVGWSMVKQMIYGGYPINEKALPVLLKIRDYAQKVRDITKQLENSK